MVAAQLLDKPGHVLSGLVSGLYKAGSGDVREIIVLIAVLLRLEARGVLRAPSCMPEELRDGRVELITSPGEVMTTVALENWAKRLSAGKRDALLLVYPMAAAFEDYDIVLVAGGRAVSGWQCKTKQGYPNRPAPISGASWIMNGGGAENPAARVDGWKIAGRSAVTSFLGTSLALAVPALWETSTSQLADALGALTLSASGQ
jgi:hypothetical protein